GVTGDLFAQDRIALGLQELRLCPGELARLLCRLHLRRRALDRCRPGGLGGLLQVGLADEATVHIRGAGPVESDDRTTGRLGFRIPLARAGAGPAEGLRELLALLVREFEPDLDPAPPFLADALRVFVELLLGQRARQFR